MDIKFFKAGQGDSILISSNSHNILIDGGNDSSFLLKEIDAIKERKEVLNLIIITHHDDDHIKGIEDLLKHIDTFPNRDQFVKQIFLNSPRLIKGMLKDTDDSHLSYKQAYEMEDLITRFHFLAGFCTDNTPVIKFENLSIQALSPTQECIEKYSNAKGAYLSSDHRCDWGERLFDLEKSLDDDSLDSDAANRTSIVLNVKFDDKNILLTGDITPKRFNDIIDKMYYDNGNQPVLFDLIKLPHHGSYRNLSKGILEKINCTKFVICTNGKNNFLPNKRAMLKVLKHTYREKDQELEFIFNYEEVLDYLKITSEEMKHYNFKLTSTKNDYYGISY